MTANAFHSDRVECLAAGMNDFVTKPIEVKELEAAIRRVMPSSAERPAAPVPPRTLCNRQKLNDLVDFIGVNALAEILEEFEADGERLLAKLGSAVQAGAEQRAHAALDSLVESTTTLGMVEAATAAGLWRERIGRSDAISAEEIADLIIGLHDDDYAVSLQRRALGSCKRAARTTAQAQRSRATLLNNPLMSDVKFESRRPRGLKLSRVAFFRRVSRLGRSVARPGEQFMPQGVPILTASWRRFLKSQQDKERAAGNVRAFDLLCEDLDVFCENHIDLASYAAIRRKQQTQKRLAFVQDLWNDAERFDKIVSGGRYLKLCHLTEWISDCDEQAWARMKSEILAARQMLRARSA